MTGEDGSYDVKYNRVENMLGELTRLMDNMESSMIPQQQVNILFKYFNSYNSFRMQISKIKIQL
jgi:hypothetical protein